MSPMRNRTNGVARWAGLLAAIGASFGCGTSQRAGRGATAGALDEMRRQIAEARARNEAPMEQIARSAVRGSLGELGDPARQAEIAQVTRFATDGALASLGLDEPRRGWGGGPAPDALGLAGDRFSMGFTLGLSRQLQAELGPAGDGPLGRSFSGLARQVSGAMASGVVAELPLETGAAPSSHLDSRVYDISRSAAAGFADGIAGALRWPLLAASFAAGLLSALVLLSFTRRRFATSRDRPRVAAPTDWS